MKLIEKMKSRLADLLGTIPEHKGDAVDSVLSHLLESGPGLNFTRAARVNERPGFTRVVRAGIAYYAKPECKVLNPFKEGGNGVYFVKGCNDDPTGLYFTDAYQVDDAEYVDAIAAYHLLAQDLRAHAREHRRPPCRRRTPPERRDLR